MENDDYLTKQLITYIGNKRKLLSFIESSIIGILGKIGTKNIKILDLFAGSGVVSRMFKQYSRELYSNDLEYFSYVIGKCYLTNKCDVPQNISEVVSFLNKEKTNGSGGIIELLYSPKDDNNIQRGERAFYSNKNARIIDNIRKMIDLLPEEERHLYIAPLLSEASICVNTSGVFKGFYKNSKTNIGQWGGNNQNCLSRILREIVLPVPIFSNYDCSVKVFNEDANILVQNISEMDITYLDPPYNQHPYGSNYFMLDVIAKNEWPLNISKVSGIPNDWKRSAYNKQQEAIISFSSLIKNIKSKYVLISYNNEGIIPMDIMKDILRKYGEVTVNYCDYQVFRGSRNLKNRPQKVTEMLYVLKK